MSLICTSLSLKLTCSLNLLMPKVNFTYFVDIALIFFWRINCGNTHNWLWYWWMNSSFREKSLIHKDTQYWENVLSGLSPDLVMIGNVDFQQVGWVWWSPHWKTHLPKIVLGTRSQGYLGDIWYDLKNMKFGIR